MLVMNFYLLSFFIILEAPVDTKITGYLGSIKYKILFIIILHHPGIAGKNHHRQAS